MGKIKQVLIIGAGLFALSVNLQAQTTTPDSIVQVAAEAEGLSLVAPQDLPASGTFWEALPGGIMAPLPFPPGDASLPTYQITDGIFLVDSTGGQVTVRGLHGMAMTGDLVAAALATESNAVANLIDDVQAAQFDRQLLRRSFGMADSEADGGDDLPMNSGGPPVDPNGLWLQITNYDGNFAYANLNNGTNQVYAIESTTNLLSPWQVELELWPTTAQTNVLPFTVPALNRNPLFVRAEDWTGVDSDGDGIPDWWAWKYFGVVNVNATNLDSQGNTLLYDYQQGQDPDPIIFELLITNSFVNTSSAIVPLNVLGGTPFYMAVLVNDDDTVVWMPYSSNLVANLNSGDGSYYIMVGLRGHADDSTPSWQHISLVLDTVPPALVITNPATLTVSNTTINLQGYANETLGSLSFDVGNASGMATNQTGYMTGSYFDDTLSAYTTNYFTCPVNLAGGSNSVTLHATDLAGNTTDLNLALNCVVDTSQPGLTVLWPADGTPVSGSSFTVQAQVNNPAAAVSATIVDASGNTNTVLGLVEGNGQAWIRDLPLSAGNNAVTVTAGLASGATNTQTFTVVGNDVGLVIDPLTQLNQSQVTVTGTVGDPVDDCVWVNGVQAYYTDESGDWEAGVPVNPGGTAVLDVQVYVGDPVLIGEQTQLVPQPVTVQAMSYRLKEHDEYAWFYLGGEPGRYWGDLDTEWLAGVGGYDAGTGYDDNLPGPFNYQNPIGPEPGALAAMGRPLENADVDLEDPSESGLDQHQIFTRTQVLAPGGQTAGQTNVYLVRLAAMTADKDANPMDSLPPEAFQINGQPLINTGETNTDGPNAGGAVWGATTISAPAGQNAEVTPAFITPPSGNWDYYFDEQAVQLYPPMVDANRDGQIDGNDVTTASQPYRFWVNDSRESGDIAAGANYQIPGQPAQSPDNEGLPYANYAYNQVQGRSDLVNFFPVALNLSAVLQQLPPTNGWEYHLSQADSAVKFVYTSLTPANAFDYLTKTASSGYGTNADEDVTTADTLQVTNSQSSGTILDTNWLAMVQNNGGTGVILMEGCAATTQPLVLEIWHNGQKVAGVPLYLDIDSVEKMYRHKNLRDGADAPAGLAGDTSVRDADASQTTRMDEPPNNPDASSNGKWFTFVVGSNVGGQNTRGWESEVFKRLYWSGNKAKFVGVAWYGDPYTNSEGVYDYHLAVQNAFATAPALASFVNGLSGNKTIAGHSLGCGLIASALADQGMTVNNACLMDAAFAQECFDDGADENLTAMQPSAWNGYSEGLFAANWFQRFDSSDARSKLTWRNRFANALNNGNVYSFYSSTEDALGEYDGEVPTSALDALLVTYNNGVPTESYVWTYQEKAKGNRQNYYVPVYPGHFHVGSTYGGWGFNVCDGYLTNYPTWYAIDGTTGDRRVKTPAEIGTVTQDMLDGSVYNPLFNNGWGTWNSSCPVCINVNTDPSLYTGPSWIQGLYTTTGGSTLAADPVKRNQLLAEAIPALSMAVGSHKCSSILDGKQFDMASQFADSAYWPRQTLIGQLPKWWHSDMDQMAYPLIYKLYNQLVSISNQ